MWKLLFESAQGVGHSRFGEPCQDHAIGTCVSIAGETVLVAACSDGAGSAVMSEVGSRVAVDEFVRDGAAAGVRDV